LQDEAERDTLREIISNSKLSEHFLALARDLDVMEPKVPEDVYKTHLTGAAKCQGLQKTHSLLDSTNITCDCTLPPSQATTQQEAEYR
jgi:hypothetical protein